MKLHHNKIIKSKTGYTVLILALISFSTLFCQTKNETVLQVNGREIGIDEFSSRLNSVPIADNLYSVDELKENILCTLIAETVFSLEAASNNIGEMPRMKLFIDEYHKEALYEKWMDAEVKSQIKITPEEMKAAYKKLIEKRIVEYWTAPNEKEAKKTVLDIKNNKAREADGVKELAYAESLENIEDAVYSLKGTEVSKPIKVDDEYYIFRLKKTEPHPNYSKENFIYWQPVLDKLIRNRKELSVVSEKLSALMKDKGFSVNKDAYKFIVSELDAVIYKNGELKAPQPEAIQQEIAFKKLSSEDQQNVPLIFLKNGKTISVGEFWKELIVSPYPMNYKNPDDLRKGLMEIIQRTILMDNISDAAVKKGYESSYYVNYQTDMWKNNLLAFAFINEVTKSIHLDEKRLVSFYDTTKYDYVEPEKRRIIPLIVKDKSLAEELSGRIKNGEDIAVLAKKYSLNKTTINDNVPGIFITEDYWGGLGKNIFKMRVGEIKGPVFLEDSSYAIVKLLEIQKAAVLKYDEVKDKVYSKLLDNELQQKLADHLKTVIKKYKITINRAALKKVEYAGGNLSVKKTHFPLRNAAPSFPLFGHDAKWYTEGVVSK